MSSIREALELIDLGAWLEQYVDLKSAGGDEYRIEECPECGNDKWKLYVNTEKQRWICYVCDWGRGIGDPVRLMSAVSGRRAFDVRVELMGTVTPAAPAIEQGYLGALEAVFDGQATSIDEEQEPEEIVLPGFPDFNPLSMRGVLAYARARGLTDNEILENQLRPALRLKMNRRDGSQADIRGPFLLFPVFYGGRPVSWQGRKIEKSDIPYVSAPNIKEWLWPLSPAFFQLYTDYRLVLVEGVFDALGFHRLGVPALCTFGKSISDEQLEIIADLYPEEIIFAWDIDAYREMERAVRRIADEYQNTRVVDFSVGAAGKIDAGDSLKQPELGEWLMERLNSAMHVGTPEFFQWQISNK
jgi:hypothetical protein